MSVLKFVKQQTVMILLYHSNMELCSVNIIRLLHFTVFLE